MSAKNMMTKQELENINETIDDYFDYVMRTVVQGDFIEVTGCRGGDVRTYRFYSSGLITER